MRKTNILNKVKPALYLVQCNQFKIGFKKMKQLRKLNF